MTKQNRSSTRTVQPRMVVTAGGAVLVSLGTAVCLLAWSSGESLPLAVLTAAATVAALLDALVAVATFLAGHPRDAEARTSAAPKNLTWESEKPDDLGPLRPSPHSERPDLPEA